MFNIFNNGKSNLQTQQLLLLLLLYITALTLRYMYLSCVDLHKNNQLCRPVLSTWWQKTTKVRQTCFERHMKKKDYCYTTLLPLSVHYRQGSIHSSSFFFVSHSPLGVFSLLLLFPFDFSFFRRGARGDQKETGGCGRRSFHNPPCTASIFLASCL